MRAMRYSTITAGLAAAQVIISGGALAVYYLAEGSDIWNQVQLYTVHILVFIAALNFLG